MLVLIRQFSCLLCRLHIKDLQKNQVNITHCHCSNIVSDASDALDVSIFAESISVRRQIRIKSEYCAFISLHFNSQEFPVVSKSGLEQEFSQSQTHQQCRKRIPSNSSYGVALQSSLDAHSVQVVVVSFGCPEGASHWLQQTGCQYDMLLDPDRKVRGQHQAAQVHNRHFRVINK